LEARTVELEPIPTAAKLVWGTNTMAMLAAEIAKARLQVGENALPEDLQDLMPDVLTFTI
jgi:hypothetical protein